MSCESGWTVYLDESWSLSHEEWHSSDRGSNPREDAFYRGKKVEGEEENLSLVSDASSGPPFSEVEDNCSNASFSSGKRLNKSKNKAGERGKRDKYLNYYYEDTACSTHRKRTEQEKNGSRCFHYSKNSAPAEKAKSGKKVT